MKKTKNKIMKILKRKVLYINKKGFTLVELLAVIAVLAILAIFAVPNVIKVYNKSLEESFKTQVKATARSAENYAVLNDTTNTFDCSSFEKGDSYDLCSATKKDNELVIDAIGKGKFENFLMVDYNKKTGEGQFVNLKDLNTIDATETKVNENLIVNGEINNFFHSLTAREMIDIELQMASEEDRLTQEEIEEIIPVLESKINYRIENGKIVSNSDEGLLLVTFDITSAGRYILSSQSEIVQYDSPLLEMGPMSALELAAQGVRNLNIEDYYTVEILDNNTIIFDIVDPDKYMMIMPINSNSTGFNISSESEISNLSLKGDKIVYLKPSQVSSYKDAGIILNGTKLTGNNNYYEYTNLTNKEGTYTYNYVIKTPDGIIKRSRTIEVFEYTNANCFEFDKSTKTITDYSSSCPKDVNIPSMIDGVTVENIGESAFNLCNYLYSYNDSGLRKVGALAETTCNKKINSVTLPNTIKTIGSMAFYDNNLVTVNIPNSVTIIGDSAFSENKLTSITIPNSVTSIGWGAFRYNPLTEVIINGTPLGDTMPSSPTIGSYAFCSTVNNRWCK